MRSYCSSAPKECSRSLRYLYLAQLALGALWCSSSFAADPYTPSSAELKTEYSYIKSAMALRYKELRKKQDQEAKREAPSSPAKLEQQEEALVIVFDCGFEAGLDFEPPGAGGVYSGASVWALTLFIVAKGALQLEFIAVGHQYPENVWRPRLMQYEASGIALAQKLSKRNFKDRVSLINALPDYPTDIVESMERVRVATRKKTPRLQSMEGCGAGDFAAEIISVPVARVVRVMPEFFALVCERTGRSLVGTACPYWKDAPQNAAFAVSGLYRYFAMWPDGTERAGKVDFDKLLGVGDVPKFVIRK